jgi:hypothetical protein
VLKIAIVYEDDPKKVFIAFEPNKFVELLKSYYKQHKDIGKAMKAIEFDLKQKTLYK